jgi:glutamyl-tRNA reductase
VAFGADKLPHALSDLTSDRPVREAAILSTCNRTEIYCAAESPEVVIDWLAHYHQVGRDELAPYVYTHDQPEAIRHAFRVASGLDSMVIGEPQILGQMKDAVRLPKKTARSAPSCTRSSSAPSRWPRKCAARRRSAPISSRWPPPACIWPNAFSSRYAGQRILFIGAGEMIELCAAHFCAGQPKQVTIANRTLERGRALAERMAARPCVSMKWPSTWAHDIVVSCTASPLPIIGLGMVERAIKARRHRPMFMVDLAVPRDIERSWRAGRRISSTPSTIWRR